MTMKCKLSWMMGLVGMGLLVACSQPAPQPPKMAEMPPAQPSAADSPGGPKAAKTAEVPSPTKTMEPSPAAGADELPPGANKLCPVMGGKAKKQYHVEYKGRTIYFCCDGCPQKFTANPAKYMAKLQADEAKEKAGGEKK